MSINEKLHNLFIGLESIDLYAIDTINILKDHNTQTKQNQTYSSIKYHIYKKYNYSFQEVLFLISTIAYTIQTKHLQETIENILTDYSYFSDKHISLLSLSTQKYLNRFIYKHQIYYTYKTPVNTYIQYDEIQSIYDKAIIQLYILNKLISKKGTYTLYKYLNLNVKFP